MNDQLRIHNHLQRFIKNAACKRQPVTEQKHILAGVRAYILWRIRTALALKPDAMDSTAQNQALALCHWEHIEALVRSIGIHHVDNSYSPFRGIHQVWSENLLGMITTIIRESPLEHDIQTLRVWHKAVVRMNRLARRKRQRAHTDGLLCTLVGFSRID